ncbi:MAG: SHOCT domain-containing protein [Clostridia bacterium]|nr:SHOCT domain-containing protein [Clostridia bacterium]
MKKNFYYITITLGFVLYLVCSILASLSEGYAPFVEGMNLYVILMIAFCFSKNKTLNIVGYSIGGIIIVYSIFALNVLGQGDDFNLLLPYISALVMGAASVVYFVGLCLKFFGFIKKNGCQDTQDSKIDLLRLYAELNKDGLLTDEEFAEIKSSVIKGSIKENKEKLAQIKELKKLFDEQVITKEEFITFNK